MDATLKPFVEKLQILGDDMGYDFQLQMGIVCLRGALLAVIADTPTSNLLGGDIRNLWVGQRESVVTVWLI